TSKILAEKTVLANSSPEGQTCDGLGQNRRSLCGVACQVAIVPADERLPPLPLRAPHEAKGVSGVWHIAASFLRSRAGKTPSTPHASWATLACPGWRATSTARYCGPNAA